MAEEAAQQKELGTAAYKSKDFTKALEHYENARVLEPTNCIYELNKAAVYLEMKDYEKCIAACNASVEVGMENRADFQTLAKAYARAAKAYAAQGNLEKGIEFYDKALANHRTPDYLKAKQELAKELKERKAKEYIDPALATEAKNRGNDFFKQNMWPEAVKEYEEAIKRNPSDAKVYSNRAAAYIKLLAFDLAIKDCDECIKLEPKFAKAHVRKAKALEGQQKFTEAAKIYQHVLEFEPDNADALEGIKKTMQAQSQMTPEERRAHAMQDPEIQDILKDQVFQSMLQKLQEDPTAARDYLKNPDFKVKFQKLVDAGIISIR